MGLSTVGGTMRIDTDARSCLIARAAHRWLQCSSSLDGLWAEHEALQDGRTICPHVFHGRGRRIKNLRKAWALACEAAGHPGKLRTISGGRRSATWSARAYRDRSRCS